LVLAQALEQASGWAMALVWEPVSGLVLA